MQRLKQKVYLQLISWQLKLHKKNKIGAPSLNKKVLLLDEKKGDGRVDACFLKDVPRLTKGRTPVAPTRTVLSGVTRSSWPQGLVGVELSFLSPPQANSQGRNTSSRLSHGMALGQLASWHPCPLQGLKWSKLGRKCLATQPIFSWFCCDTATRGMVGSFKPPSGEQWASAVGQLQVIAESGLFSLKELKGDGWSPGRVSLRLQWQRWTPDVGCSAAKHVLVIKHQSSVFPNCLATCNLGYSAPVAFVLQSLDHERSMFWTSWNYIN